MDRLNVEEEPIDYEENIYDDICDFDLGEKIEQVVYQLD